MTQNVDRETVVSRLLAADDILILCHKNPDGDTIPDNNMTGQICMHFTNSKGHESGKVDTYHQQAIEYAWQNCPAGRK